MDNYNKTVNLFRALSEPIHLKILDMISCREMCACEILAGLSISQSTLSHHMSVLQKVSLVSARKEATWMIYSINQNKVTELHKSIDLVMLPRNGCICEQIPEADIMKGYQPVVNHNCLNSKFTKKTED